MTVLDKVCTICGDSYIAKDKAYKSKYCSKKCKNKGARMRANPILKSEARKRRYLRIKNNPERYGQHLLNNNNSAKVVRAWLAEYKVQHGCIDCGYNKHFAALQIDHQGNKTANISDLRSSKERILEEIEAGQCVVRCAVCHAVKTWAEKNGIKYEPNMAYDQNVLDIFNQETILD